MRGAAFLLLVLAGSLASGADPTPALKIVVPDGDVLVGEDVDLPVAGLSVEDMQPGKIAFFPPDNARAKLTVEWTPDGLRPVVFFRAKTPGRHKIILVRHAPQFLVSAVAVLEVKGDGSPNPPVPPPPPGKLTVMVVEETANRSKLPPAQAAWLTSPTFRRWLTERGHVFLGTKDKDAKGPGDAPAEKIADFLRVSSGAGKPLPCIVARRADGSFLVSPPPSDEDAAVKWIQANGG